MGAGYVDVSAATVSTSDTGAACAHGHRNPPDPRRAGLLGDGGGQLAVDMAGEQAEIVEAPALQRVEGTPMLWRRSPRRWRGGPPFGPPTAPAEAGLCRPMVAAAGMPSAAPDAPIAQKTGRHDLGWDRKGVGFVLTVEPVPTIGPSDGPSTLGRRQSGDGTDV